MPQWEAHVDRQAAVAGLMTSIEAFCQRVQTGVSNTTCAQKRQLIELLIT
jgi:site-specific DNA recombinase